MRPENGQFLGVGLEAWLSSDPDGFDQKGRLSSLNSSPSAKRIMERTHSLFFAEHPLCLLLVPGAERSRHEGQRQRQVEPRQRAQAPEGPKLSCSTKRVDLNHSTWVLGHKSVPG